MEAVPTSIIKYFSGFHQYLVPLFQRPYTLTEKQWKTLWEDIEHFLSIDAASSATHFMGAIVTMPARSVPIGVSKFSVIDGQQRLTTVAILLAAIRDELPAEDVASRKRIQNHYLTNEGYEGPDYFKVLPTQGDRSAYASLIQSSGVPVPDSQVQKAHDFFKKKLRSCTDVRDCSKRVLEVLERHLMVVMINLSDTDDPYQIFESLNFKGSPLEQADLVRNYFLMRIPINEQESVYSERWLPMQERLGSSLTEFMRHFLGSRGEEVRKGDVYASIKRSLAAATESAEVRAFMTEMERLSALYNRISNPSSEPDAAIRQYFQRFQRLDFGTVYPLLLALYKDLADGRFTADEFVETLRVLDSFIVRRMVVGVASNSLSGLFISLSKLRPATESPADWLATALANEARNRRWPEDAEFEQMWETRSIYGSRACSVVLGCIEEQFGHREQANLDDSTIEHIMPQTLNPEWERALGEDHPQVHSIWLHTVGNLTLTGYNQELGNKSFAEKKAIYAESHFELNRYFAEAESWSVEEIRNRAQSLFQYARKLWPKNVVSPASPTTKKPAADFHPACIARASVRLRVNLTKRSTRRYENNDKGVRLFCAVSAEHDENSETPYYWFGFPPAEQIVLEATNSPWICLGCGSADTTLLIPARLILDLIPRMSVSVDAVHSHLVVHLKRGKYLLMLLGGVEGLELNQYLLKDI